MSLLLLIDGYNVLAPIAPPGRIVDPRWLHRERMRLLGRLASTLDESTRRKTCVVFDAASPPSDRADRFKHEGIDVRFAVEHAEADDLLEALIAAHSSPKRLAVVSSDHRVQAAARRRGATPYDSQPWLDDLIDGRVRLSPRIARHRRATDEPDPTQERSLPPTEVDQWLDEFGLGDE